MPSGFSERPKSSQALTAAQSAEQPRSQPEALSTNADGKNIERNSCEQRARPNRVKGMKREGYKGKVDTRKRLSHTMMIPEHRTSPAWKAADRYGNCIHCI